MSVKLFDATAHQMAKALKKQAKKSPTLLNGLATNGFTKANGTVSVKKITKGLLTDCSDSFTKSGKLTDNGKALLMEDGATKKTTLKEFIKSITKDVGYFEKAETTMQDVADAAARNVNETVAKSMQDLAARVEA